MTSAKARKARMTDGTTMKRVYEYILTVL